MAEAEEIFEQTLNEVRRQLAALRKLANALDRRKQARVLLEHMRNARSQNPQLDNLLNRDPDRARQWGDTERELRELQAENARLAADNEQRLAAIQENQGELERQQAELDDRDRDGIPDPRQDREDFDRDHVPDRTERLDQQAADRQQAEELEDATEDRDQQADDSERADELEDAADDREEQAEQDERTAEQREQDERRRQREEGQDGPDVGTTAAAAGTAAFVADELEDERDERAVDPDGESEPEQVQGAQGPEVEQGGQAVDRDNAAQPGIGDDQQPGQDQQGAGVDQPGMRVVGQDGQEVPREADGSIRNATFVVGGQDQETQQDQPGQDQRREAGVDQPAAQAERQNEQGQRDPLDARLAEDRQANGRPNVRVQGGIDGVETGGQQLPDGVYKSREGGGFSYEGTTPSGQQVQVNVGAGAEFGGQRDEELFKQTRAQQAGVPPAGSPRPEGVVPAEATGHGGKTAGAHHAKTVNKGAGRGNEGGGLEPKGR